MKFLNLLFIFCCLLFVSCKTSGDLRSEANKDPGEIRTVVNPVHENAEQRDPVELEKELVVTKGSLEELRYTSNQEKLLLKEKIAQLEDVNAQLTGELEKLQWAGFSQDQAAGQMESSAGLMWKKAMENIQGKKYARAFSLLDVFAKSNPKDAGLFYVKTAQAMILYNQGKYKKSLISFNKIIDDYSKHSRVSLAWFGQGAAFSKNGQGNDSKLFFEETVRRSAKSTEAKLSKKILKQKAQPPEDIFEAIADWNKEAPYEKSRKASKTRS